MSHQKECFQSRLEFGMRFWDKKNPEPNENLDPDGWIEWYKKRCGIQRTGVAKLSKELNVSVVDLFDPPCTCQ